VGYYYFYLLKLNSCQFCCCLETKTIERDFHHNFSNVKVLEHSNGSQNEPGGLNIYSRHLAPKQNALQSSGKVKESTIKKMLLVLIFLIIFVGKEMNRLQHIGNNWQPPISKDQSSRDDEHCPVDCITSQSTTIESKKPALSSVEKMPSVHIHGNQATDEKSKDRQYSITTVQDHPRLCFRGNTSILNNRDDKHHDLCSVNDDGKTSGLASAPLDGAIRSNRKSHSCPVVTSRYQIQSSSVSSGYSTVANMAAACHCNCHKASCTSVAVQTDVLNTAHHQGASSGVAPSHSAQCLELSTQGLSTGLAISKSKSWNVLQEKDNHHAWWSGSSSDGEVQLKDKGNDLTSTKSWNFDGLDAILSTNLLKECYSAIGKTNYGAVPPPLSDDIMKIVKQGEQIQKESREANYLAVPVKRSFSFPTFTKISFKEESSLKSTSPIQSSKSVDLFMGPREPSFNFNMLTEELRKDKVLPSQIHAQEMKLLHELHEKRENKVQNTIYGD